MKNIDKNYVIVYLYMNDMLILSSINHTIKSTKKILINKLDIKDLGVANIILGIKPFKISNVLILSQSYYVEKVLEKFYNDDNSIIKTPIYISIYLFKNRGKRITN